MNADGVIEMLRLGMRGKHSPWRCIECKFHAQRILHGEDARSRLVCSRYPDAIDVSLRLVVSDNRPCLGDGFGGYVVHHGNGSKSIGQD